MGEANISIASNSLHYGTMCFGGIRGYWEEGMTRIFRLEEHYQRLMSATKILGIPFSISYENFKDIIVNLIKKNNHKGNVYLRPMIFF